MKKLSIVVPCYNEEEVLETFYKTVSEILKDVKIEKEYVFIDDGSKDKTLEILRKLAKKDKNVRYISFSRNFGKEAGMFAGLENATGDYVVVMDADLQHDPKLLPKMLETLEKENYHSVAVRRINRKEGLRGFLSKKFFKIMSKLSGLNTAEGEMDYRMMKRNMVDACISMKEKNRFTKGIFSYVGFNTKWIEQENIERELGSTKWNMKGLIKYSLEGITAFSTTPLIYSAILGMLFILIAFILFVVVIVKMIGGATFFNFITLLCFLFVFSGIQLFALGVIGEYLSKMYLEIKNRPVYLVKETEKDLD